MFVASQAPARIKRLAVAVDGFAAKQGFEACKRGHGVDFVGMLQTGEDVGFGGGLVGVTGAFFGRDGTDAVAADDIRVRFVDDVGIRIALADGTQQVEVAADFREVKRLETEAGDKKAAIEEEYASLAAPLKAEIEGLTAGVSAYCEAHKDELTENGKTKTVDFTTGLVKWRIRPPSVKVTGVAAVLAWMKEKTAFAEFIRTKEEIDKDAVLNQKERFADGQVPGLKIVSGLEDFVIEPTEQELA